MSKFFTLHFWFNANAGALEPNIEKILLVVLGILLILTIFVSTTKKSKQNGLYYKTYNSLQVFFICNLILGIFLYFFTYQGIYFFSARFWFLVWAVFAVTWLIFIVRSYSKIPNIKENFKRKKEFTKYLP